MKQNNRGFFFFWFIIFYINWYVLGLYMRITVDCVKITKSKKRTFNYIWVLVVNGHGTIQHVILLVLPHGDESTVMWF